MIVELTSAERRLLALAELQGGIGRSQAMTILHCGPERAVLRLLALEEAGFLEKAALGWRRGEREVLE